MPSSRNDPCPCGIKQRIRGHERFPESQRLMSANENNHNASPVGRVPSRGATPHEFTRINRSWRWQESFHDHKFRTRESEARKWEYVCLNPVRYGLAQRPEDWPYGGEIFYDDASGPRLVRGAPPLLETGILLQEKTPGE